MKIIKLGMYRNINNYCSVGTYTIIFMININHYFVVIGTLKTVIQE